MDGFITFEQLRTFAGQLLVVTMIAQAIKSSYPAISTYLLRLSVILAAMGVNVAVAISMGATLWISTYLLAPVNGLMVALAAMKAAELIKGEKNGEPAPVRVPVPPVPPAGTP